MEKVEAPYFFLAQPHKQLGIGGISWMKKATIKRKKRKRKAAAVKLTRNIEKHAGKRDFIRSSS